MLIQFSVSNFASIRDEITLSMLADSDKEHSDTLFSFRNDRILPSAIMYGANAAGKTSIIRALTAAIVTLRQSNNRQITEPIGLMQPFAFDEQMRDRPCKFDFIFTVGEVKYAYGYTADHTRVYDEYLYVYQTSKPSMIFERTNTTEYRFINAKRNRFNEYADKNTDNKLFLATATAWNCKETQEAFRWLAEGIDTYNSETLETQMPAVLDNDSDGQLRKYVTAMLHAADINISGYSIKTSSIGPEDIPTIPVALMQQLANGQAGNIRKYEIITQHIIENEAGQNLYFLPFELESNGTQRFMYLSPVIKHALENGRTIIIDEIDAGLHPLLVDYIIRIFADRQLNPHGAQLIVTTQDVSLLDLDRFRRDQIYFVEKNNQTGVTDLYSLDEFAPRKNADIRKGYLQGRYGAIPAIGSGGIAW